MIVTDEMLEGRMARCGIDHGTTPSSQSLPFFQFRGEGSLAAIDSCLHCGYSKFAHGEEASRWKNGKTAVENAGCPGFEPHGPWDYDLYYCGCRGWE